MFIRRPNVRFAPPRPNMPLVKALSDPQAVLARHSVGAEIFALNEQIKSAAGDELATYAARRKRDQLQATVAAAYGLVRGWHSRQRPFSLVELSIGQFVRVDQPGRLGRNRPSEDAPYGLLDHATFWVCGGPMAVVTHAYGVNAALRQEAVVWAARHGLYVRFPSDFPSWHLPTMTTLIEITRAP